MNIYILINYSILAILFTFLLAETMSAISFLYDRKSLSVVKKYLDPIWGIVGTFAVFFIVNTEVLYPAAMPSIDYLYVFPILLAILLFIARNFFLIISEYIWKDSRVSQLSFSRIYSVISMIIVLILLIVFISIITGLGVNASLSSFSFLSFLSNYYSIGLIAGVLFLVFGLSFAFYRIQKIKALSPISTALGLILIILSMKGLGISINYITYLLAAVLLAIPLVYYVTGKSKRELIFIVLFLSVFSINLLNYNIIFRTHSLSSFLNNSAVSSAGLAVTIVGGVLLASMLLFFFYMYKRPDSKNDYQKNYSDEKDPFDRIGMANIYIMPNNNKENGKEYKKRKNKQR